jgi:hypothetical protein
VVEFNMASLYCGLKGLPRIAKHMKDYGSEGRVTSARITLLENTAARFFVAHPDQGAEGEFAEIIRDATELTQFRHRIAHGITWKRNHYGSWFLMPPWYTEKLNFAGQEYLYSANQIDAIADHFSDLAARVKAFRKRLALP